MIETSRPSTAGATYFLTARLAGADSRLLVEEFGTLTAAFSATKRFMPFHLDAWVVMPDHMHAVWTLPPGDEACLQRWSRIKRHFTMSLPARARGNGPVWVQGVDMRPVQGLVDYSDAIRRCWFDPVRHDLARVPEDWAYSSAHLEDSRISLVG